MPSVTGVLRSCSVGQVYEQDSRFTQLVAQAYLVITTRGCEMTRQRFLQPVKHVAIMETLGISEMTLKQLDMLTKYARTLFKVPVASNHVATSLQGLEQRCRSAAHGSTSNVRSCKSAWTSYGIRT